MAPSLALGYDHVPVPDIVASTNLWPDFGHPDVVARCPPASHRRSAASTMQSCHLWMSFAPIYAAPSLSRPVRTLSAGLRATSRCTLQQTASASPMIMRSARTASAVEPQL